jgi:uncharacterized membrane protein
MKLFSNLLLITHILFGAISLLTGLVSMLNRKGSAQHRNIGKIFFISMTLVFITAIILSIFKNNPFLFMVGFFSYYLTCSGYRSIYLKKIHMQQKVSWLDWLIGGAGFIFGVALIVYSITGFIKTGHLFNIVPAVFGAISLLFGFFDLRRFYKRPGKKTYWLESHALKMSGAFTATVTAFSVVNIHINQQWIIWILPTAIIPLLGRKAVNKLLAKKQETT